MRLKAFAISFMLLSMQCKKVFSSAVNDVDYVASSARTCVSFVKRLNPGNFNRLFASTSSLSSDDIAKLDTSVKDEFIRDWIDSVGA